MSSIDKIIRNYDPTHTTSLRRAFAADMKRRFEFVKRAVVKKVETEDFFNLKQIPAAYDYSVPSQETFVEFQAWLQEMIDTNILGEVPRWTNKYINTAYKVGTMRGEKELKALGFEIPTGESSPQPWMGFVPKERMTLLLTRTFGDLKGVTDWMASAMQRVLTQGMYEGDNPKVLAKEMIKIFTGKGENLSLTDTLGRFIPAERRAEMIARTEIIRAHHLANIQMYRNWGVKHIKVKAEWSTAGYNVCDICAGLDGEVFTLDKIETMIPQHPGCRCMAIPIEV